jgi:selenocysteine lyase/cysteine desulfurase
VHSALGGQEIIDEIGVPAIRARNQALTERLIDGLREHGRSVRAAAAAEDRSAIVMVADQDPAATVSRLADARIIVDWRPGYVRVSPHFYNTGAEVDQVVRELAR